MVRGKGDVLVCGRSVCLHAGYLLAFAQQTPDFVLKMDGATQLAHLLRHHFPHLAGAQARIKKLLNQTGFDGLLLATAKQVFLRI